MSLTPNSTVGASTSPLQPGSQLPFITEQFEAHGIPYWLNSGTLLGMVRDNRLIENDRDIDVSVWWEDRERTLEMISSWKPQRIQAWRFGDSIYKIKVYPRDRKTTRMIDVDLFRRHNDHAWCPQFAPRTFFTHRKRVRRLVRNGCRKLAHYFLNRNGFQLSDHLGLRLVHNVYTWWVPLRFLDELAPRQFDCGQFYVPRDPETYLEYRYGNWRRPATNWSFLDDDQGLVHKHPLKMVA